MEVGLLSGEYRGFGVSPVSDRSALLTVTRSAKKMEHTKMLGNNSTVFLPRPPRLLQEIYRLSSTVLRLL